VLLRSPLIIIIIIIGLKSTFFLQENIAVSMMYVGSDLSLNALNISNTVTYMRSSFFRDVTQRKLVVTGVSGQPVSPILKGLLDLCIGDRGVVPKRRRITINLRCVNIPEEQRFNLCRGRSLK